MHIFTVYLPNVADVTACSWQTCPGLEHVLRELHTSGACSSVFKRVWVKRPSSQMQNWYHVDLWFTQRAAGVTIGRGMAGQVRQRPSPFQHTAPWKLLCDSTSAIWLTMLSDFVLGEELRELEDKTCWRNQRPSRRKNGWKGHKEEQLQPCHGLWCQVWKTQGLGCPKYCCKYHVHISNAKYNMKMSGGIDLIYMGCHILSSVSCTNSELIDFCSLFHLNHHCI